MNVPTIGVELKELDGALRAGDYRGGVGQLYDPAFDESLKGLIATWKKRLDAEVAALGESAEVRKIGALESRRESLAANLAAAKQRESDREAAARNAVIAGEPEDAEGLLAARQDVLAAQTRMSIVDSALTQARAAAESHVRDAVKAIGGDLALEAKAIADKACEKLEKPLRDALLAHFAAVGVRSRQEAVQSWTLATVLGWVDKHRA